MQRNLLNKLNVSNQTSNFSQDTERISNMSISGTPACENGLQKFQKTFFFNFDNDSNVMVAIEFILHNQGTLFSVVLSFVQNESYMRITYDTVS